MKKMKRLVVLCLVAAMCMGLAIPAMAADTNQAGAFVTQLYEGLLGRQPDDAGKVDFINKIVNQGMNGAAVAEAIASSAEFRSRQLSNEEYVRVLYKGLLGRDVDANGIATFKGALDVGYSRSWVFQQLVSSLEFTQLCLNYGLHVGTISTGNKAPNVSQTSVHSGLAAQYVEQLYTHLLGRSSSGDPGAQTWIDKLTKREMSAAGVAASIASTAEFNSRGLTNGEFVQAAYWALLGRAVDAGGWTTFMTHLNNGKSRSWVFSQICASAEFQSRFGEMNAVAGKVTPTGFPISSGVNTGAAEAFVDRAYLNLLGRYAAESERAHWVKILTDRQMSAAGVAANIAASAEARSRDLTRADFVTNVYWTLLNRAPDEGGLNTYTKALENGYSRSWVFTKICASAEFQSRDEYQRMNVVPGYLNSASYNMG